LGRIERGVTDGPGFFRLLKLGRSLAHRVGRAWPASTGQEATHVQIKNLKKGRHLLLIVAVP